MSADKLTYLARAFQRLRDDAVQSVRVVPEQIARQAASKGELQSGAMLTQVGRAYDSMASQTTDKMVRLTYDLMGNSSAEVLEVLQRELGALRDGLSNELADFFRSPLGSWAPRNASDAVGNDYLNSMDRRITTVLDDFRFGFLGGTRLTKDPVVSVISSISNSPGAVLQSGIANVQQAATTAAAPDVIRAAVAEFLASDGVRNLPPESQQGIKDVAEVLTAELDKPNPDVSKLQRWGKRLLDIAERLGVAVAANAIGHGLFG
jgi:hypothetical protein